MTDFSAVATVLQRYVPEIAPAAQLVINQGGVTVRSTACGWLDPDTRACPTQRDTRFDLASVTKLFAVTAFMTLVEEGRVALTDPVCRVLPDFSGARPIAPYEDPLHPGAWVSVESTEGAVAAESVTFAHLLTHTGGLPAWRPLYLQSDAATAQEMARQTFFSYQPGARVVYSDIGLILVGQAIEALTAHPLDAVIRDRVTAPLGLTHTGYLPTDGAPDATVAPTEFCAWRNRRICGEVHDENAWRLGGISAHAGLFSTAEDVAAFGQMFLGSRRGARLLSAATVDAMTRLHTPGMASRRGLGFALWSADPEASGNPFSQSAFGHTGFTGTSLWMDPERDLVVALLTNEVYYGRDHRGITELRLAVHRAIVG